MIERFWAGKVRVNPSGAWVRHSDHLAEVERVEMEELDKHADLTEQFANKLTAKDEEIERLKARYAATREELLANWHKAEQALPAELERMAERFDERAVVARYGFPDSGQQAIANAILAEREWTASHLRELAAEIKGGEAEAAVIDAAEGEGRR